MGKEKVRSPVCLPRRSFGTMLRHATSMGDRCKDEGLYGTAAAVAWHGCHFSISAAFRAIPFLSVHYMTERAYIPCRTYIVESIQPLSGIHAHIHDTSMHATMHIDTYMHNTTCRAPSHMHNTCDKLCSTSSQSLPFGRCLRFRGLQNCARTCGILLC